MSTPTPPAPGEDQVDRPQRPQRASTPAPLHPVTPPVGVKRLLSLWTASTLLSFLGLLGAVLFMTDAGAELLAARPDANQALRDAIGTLHLATLIGIAVLVGLEAFLIARFRNRRRGRLGASLVAVVHVLAAPVLIEVAAGPPPMGLGVLGLLAAGAVLAAVGTVGLWLPAITRWARA